MTLLNPTLNKSVINLSQLGCKLINAIPHPIKSAIGQPVLDTLFSKHFDKEDIAFLEGKVLCIEIDDLGHREFFTVNKQCISIAQSDNVFDVRLSGNLHSFISLMKHQVDPDTLFFQRKLMITGDTELGLEVKSLFDYFQWESLPPIIRQPINLLQALFENNSK